MNAKPNNAEPLVYSFGEAADQLHCSISTVRRLVKTGSLQGLSLSGGAILTRVTAMSVRKFVERAAQGANGRRAAD